MRVKRRKDADGSGCAETRPSRLPSPISRPRAFTLVELLVVIGVIAILIGLLLPSLARARTQAKSVQCAAQLRSIGQALQIYVNNNRGYFPGWSGWHVAGGNGTGEDEPGLGWTEQLEPYFAKPTSPAYQCPAFPEDVRINYFLAARWTIFKGVRNLKWGQIKTSSAFVLGGDCVTAALYPPPFGTAPYTTDDCDKDDATQDAVEFAVDAAGNTGRNIHRTGNNVLFGDGHVDLKSRFDPATMTYDPGRSGVAWKELAP